MIRWRDRLGQFWEYGYLSGSDALKWFRDPARNQWTAVYSGSVRWIDPTGVWMEYQFNAPTVASVTQGGNATTLRLTTRFWYNSQYQLVKKQDPAGLVWEWHYDARGNLQWNREPNGARTTYTYYPGTDRVWKITNALNHTWEYTYTTYRDVRYCDVKSVRDPENATTTYVYDYELNEPAYGQVRKIVDPMERTTEYVYYPTNDPNLARRGQLQRVTMPGDFWRELDYGGAGWLLTRRVQTGPNSSELTTYSYDNWGRLRRIDYPRSADVQMGYDGENRRVWVQDGAGRREYAYDAWGRVTRQQGCCGSAQGIEVVAVSAEYDPAGRKRFERELNANDTPVRTIESVYDGLGRLTAIGDYRGQVVYTYDNATGRLQREDYPNGSYVEYTYYDARQPSQMGFVWKEAHKRQDGTLLIAYEYTYDLLGRVAQSVERRPENPTGDTTTYIYTPAGRLEVEKRDGQVSYERHYTYNPDGRWQSVYRNDALNGEHHEFYEYDPVSGRLTAVEDRVNQPYVRHEFAWHPAGTLARWQAPSVGYALVFHYDEEGRLTKVERDFGNGNLQVGYEYSYNSDGAKIWKRDSLSQKEFRYLCRIGCGGVPMRVYVKGIDEAIWTRTEDYLPAGKALGYGVNWRFSRPEGVLLMMGTQGEPNIMLTDGYVPFPAESPTRHEPTII
ncbi:MAG: hypothetical protein RMJ83_09475 [Armatimonadota bacterium]|nr:hypothetical protein [Armatimonadota bacterium]